MCVTRPASIEKVEAFKIFCKNDEGRLTTAFLQSYKEGLFYQTNQMIHVDNEKSSFFALKNFGEAVSLAKQGRTQWSDYNGNRIVWNFKNSKIVVLPVTLYNVVGEGHFYVPSDDVQCLDGYYPIYESKDIVVHHSDELEMNFMIQF